MTTPPPSLPTEGERTVSPTRRLAQADLLGLLAEPLVAPAARPHFADDTAIPWATLVQAAGLPEAKSLAARLARDFTEAHALAAEIGEGEFHRLFGPGGVCPARESSYVARDVGVILGDIGGFHRAFGFERDPRFDEAADHMACQLQFVRLLLVKLVLAEQAAAAEGSRGPTSPVAASESGSDKAETGPGLTATEAAEITREALRAFARDHLGDWILSFAARLATHARLPPYGAVAEALPALWVTLALDHGWPLGDDPHDPLAPLPDEPECGACPAPTRDGDGSLGSACPT